MRSIRKLRSAPSRRTLPEIRRQYRATRKPGTRSNAASRLTILRPQTRAVAAIQLSFSPNRIPPWASSRSIRSGISTTRFRISSNRGSRPPAFNPAAIEVPLHFVAITRPYSR